MATRKKAPVKEADPVATLSELLGELDQWRQQAKQADEMAKKISKEAILAMKELNVKTITFQLPGIDRKRRATLIEPQKTVVWPSLLDELTPAQRKLVTRTVLDMEKLSDAIDRGKISVVIVDKHSNVEEGTPSIRIS
jgi:hypothetical protein